MLSPVFGNMSVDERMLKELGLESVDDLFSDIPPEVRVEGIDLPPGMSEIEGDCTITSSLPPSGPS